MKRMLVPFIVLLFAACSSSNNNPALFTTDMLRTQYFNINNSKDTTLNTIHGSRIVIAAGTFTTDQVKLEIKEAFTAREILAAGLTTESNGQPLRSGGMIFIGVGKQSKNTPILKPIKVSIPNSTYDSAMQVFKGVETDTSINWVDPTPVDSTPQSINWVRGKELFRQKCMNCHKLFSGMTGPALANVERRGPWLDRNMLYKFIENTSLFIETNHYAGSLKQKYGSIMTSFDMNKKDIDAIFDYIKNESARPGAKEEEKAYTDSLKKELLKKYSADSLYGGTDETDLLPGLCPDTMYVSTQKQDVTQLFYDDSIDTSAVRSPESMEYLRNGFTDPNPTNGMYDFEIKTFGWYNIDAYVNGYPGTENVMLSAEIITTVDIKLHVYLFFPQRKMLSVSYDRSGNNYFFNKINNGIPLYLNDPAILFAFGSKGDRIYYGIRDFIPRKDQNIRIYLYETTEDDLRRVVTTMQLEDIDLGIDKKEKIIFQRPCNLPFADTSVVTK